ncbi:hypothetical protein LQE92_07185 [Lacrimispora sp. NSJ-141]|uniref:Uncharacterized protein n=1 Tax=Lientehia hominis TaxID=2897778 RepID=A0AAP2W8S7_9FIRM|nr:hypothetical protein [Lientehia hominis]MCD2492416.1 hypothetical protein [Lientehia hominis]
MLIVYLSNRYIRVVSGEASGGHITVRGLYYTVDHRGCILNGTVTDEEGFLEIIRELWESNGLPKKDVNLVIDSSQFTARVIDVPAQKPAQTIQYLSREFTDVGRISNPVYGCFPMPDEKEHKAKIQTVYASVVQKEFISGYLDLFERLGITIDSVECASGAMVRLLACLPQLRGMTGIVQFVDDMILVNVLLVEGRYEYSSRNRLFSDAGTREFAAEVARAVNGILQFAKAQNIPQKISVVYIAGFSREDVSFYHDSIRQINDGLRVEELDGSHIVSGGRNSQPYQCFSNFAVAIGGLIKTGAKTNIMSQMRRNPESQELKKRRRRVWVPLSVLGLVMAAAVTAAGVYSLYLSSALREVQDYNSRADVLADCEEYDNLKQEIQTAGSLNKNLTGLRSSILEYPVVDSTVEQVLSYCAAGLVSAEISSYDSGTGVVSFHTSAGNVDQIHQFATLLSQQDIFASVDYSGYTQSSDGSWSVKVNCVMAGRQGE